MFKVLIFFSMLVHVYCNEKNNVLISFILDYYSFMPFSFQKKIHTLPESKRIIHMQFY